MGSFEVFNFWIISEILSFLIITLLSLFSIKNLLTRFGIFKLNRRDYYECGFRPHSQKPIQMSFHFFIICLFFIIYDVELVFVFPICSSISFNSVYELLGFLFIYITMIISLFYDYDKNMIEWRFF